MALGPLLGFGASGVLSYGSLGGRARHYVDAAALYVISASAFTVVSSLLLFAINTNSFDLDVGVPILMCCCVMQQVAISSRLKALNRGAWASLVESGVYISLLVALIVSYFSGAFSLALFFALIVVIVVGFFILLHVAVDLGRLRNSVLKVPGFFKLGCQYLIGSSIMAVFMASPRIYLGWSDSSLAVAEFSLIFRWFSISIIMHQFINTIFFRFIYTSESTKRAIIISFVICAVGVLCFFILTLVSFKPFDFLGVPYPDADFLSMWAFGLIMVLWAATASLEGVLLRLDSTITQIFCVIVGMVVASSSLTLCYYFGLVELIWITWAWLIGFFSMVSLQLYIASVKGQRVLPIVVMVSVFLAIYVIGVMVHDWFF